MDEKSYYSISEVAELTGVTIPTLRYWEREIPQLSPKRTEGRTRRYTPRDIDTIKQIIYLTRECNLTLDGVRQKLKERNLTVDVQTRLAERLKRARAELIAIRREMNDIQALDHEVIID